MIEEQPPFFANYFCIIPNTDLAFVAISKNAVTFLKRVVYYNVDKEWFAQHILPTKQKKPEGRVQKLKSFIRLNQTPEFKERVWIKGFQETHNAIGYNANSPFLIPVSEMPEYEKINGKKIKFAVWRDPVERLISFYKNFVLQNEKEEIRDYHVNAGIYSNTSFDFFMRFLRFEWEKRGFLLPTYQDEHIRRQSDYYKQSDVDFVVPVKKLYAFLEDHNVNFLKIPANETNINFEIINETYRNEIKEYYAADYEIKCNYERFKEF